MQSLVQCQWNLNQNSKPAELCPLGYSTWYALAEVGFYGVVPFAIPQYMPSMSSIFSCRHTMYLGCILSNWFDFARAHPIYGIRPDGTFTCPMCRASINLNECTYLQLWRPRSSFPGPSNQTQLRVTFPKMIFPGRIPEQNIISYQP